MKTKATIILIICLFMAPGLAFSQSTGKSKTKEDKEREFFVKGAYPYNLDSIIAPSMRIAGEALRRTDWSQARGSYLQMFDNSKNSTLNFRKEFDEPKTLNRSYEMEFDKEQKLLDIRINAEAEEGNIQITIIQPNGKNYKVLELEDMESLTWNHSIKDFDDENNVDYSGTWQVKVSIKNAVGYYNVRLTVK
jgi:hypothetical protein